MQFKSTIDACKQNLIVTENYKSFYHSNKQLYYLRINNNILYYIHIYIVLLTTICTIAITRNTYLL